MIRGEPMQTPIPVIPSSRLQTFRRDLSELPPGRRRLLIAALVASCLLFVAGMSVSVYLWHLALQFPQAPFAQPSRLYGAPTHLTPRRTRAQTLAPSRP